MAVLKKDRVQQFPNIEETVLGADVVLICTDWKHYREINWENIKNRLNRPIIIDGRNCLDSSKLREISFIYCGVGFN
ncbi:UDP binding domain-containing protein [Neobacillus drentensis]|uniref:UDP binding domain-containing protein n=1 Tax=Neobacillus drentensis TaxID=220684 RepID=UPI003B586010